MIDVVTLLIPRDERWISYLPLLDLQRLSAQAMGHRHVVITEGKPAELAGFNTMHADMGPHLMHAILQGQIAYLEKWSGDYPVVLLDVDCLVNKQLDDAFQPEDFDIGITTRPGSPCPINNGAMYVAAGAKEHALKIFRVALSLCGEHWGGDQEAMAQACAPIPLADSIVQLRHGARIAFLSMKYYNNAPKMNTNIYNPKPYVMHFKGDTKAWMATYAGTYLGR